MPIVLTGRHVMANDSILNFVHPLSSPQDPPFKPPASSIYELTRRSPFWRERHHSTTVQCAFKEQGAAERKGPSQLMVMEQLDKQKDKSRSSLSILMKCL